MSNLFFVHTPMQLLIAQQLIHNQKLSNNIMLYGYIDDNKNYLNSYDILIIEQFWSEKLYFEHLPGFADLSHRFMVRGFINTYKNTRKILKIIQEYGVEQIYFGDIRNVTYQFAMLYFHKYCKINVYEEGSSHYNYKSEPVLHRTLKWLQKSILDFFYYIPIYHFRFSAYWFREGSYDRLPIDTRYSVVPGCNNESYDKGLSVDFNLISSKTKEILNEEIDKFDKISNREFLLTSVLYRQPKSSAEGFNHLYDVFLLVIEEFVRKINKGTLLIIKLHPRESEQTKTDIKRIVEKYNIKYLFLSNKINIPCELYFQILRPSHVTMFINSSAYYNGYLYPKCEFTDLTGRFIEICESKNINVDRIKKSYLNFYSICS